MTEDSDREMVADDDSDGSAMETLELVSEQTSASETTNDDSTASTRDPPAAVALNEADIVDSTDEATAIDYDNVDHVDAPEASVSADFDLAESADRLMRLIADESMAPENEDDDDEDDSGDADGQDDDAAAPNREAEKAAAPVGGLAGFVQWLTQTRQLGRRASRLLEAVESLRAPLERKQRLADLVRLSLLLECNSAIGFNADGTLRNTEAAARVRTAEDKEEAAALERQRADAEVAAAAAAAADDEASQQQQQQQQQPIRKMVTFEEAVVGGGGGGSGGGDDGKLSDDAEVLMANEEIQGEGGRHGLLIFTSICLVCSVLVSQLVSIESHWLTDWLVLVTATTGSLMLGIAIFVQAGRRRRPIEAYREMSRELQNNRILISTIRHG